MRVRLLRSVKDGSGWRSTGAICDFSDEEANRLIRLRAAEVIQSVSTIPSDEDTGSASGDQEESSEESSEEYSEEELREIADTLIKIDGIDEDLAYRLIEEGYVSLEVVAEADPKDLIKIKGIGKRTVVGIQESAEDLLDSQE